MRKNVIKGGTFFETRCILCLTSRNWRSSRV